VSFVGLAALFNVSCILLFISAFMSKINDDYDDVSEGANQVRNHENL